MHDLPAIEPRGGDPRGEDAREAASFEVLRPEAQSLPLVVASPHSGRAYPEAFLAASRLSPLDLRRSEDSFVDEIFLGAVKLGAPLLRALFPRAYVDPNREPYELDPAMFAGPLPDYVNRRSPRVSAGLGTIARVVANGAEIYREPLDFAEALARIERHYWPYHAALKDLVEQTRAAFGCCILLDCHSMPSSNDVNPDSDGKRPRGPKALDVVLGNCHGAACAPRVTDSVAATLERLGYSVGRNVPYSGGFVTRHYGRPEAGLHSLQIEINRALYMDEEEITRKSGLRFLAEQMNEVVRALGEIPPETLRP
ncbi:MAG: N-formylglutamate amidohydrolase [Rhodovibrionaceae bacterium]